MSSRVPPPVDLQIPASAFKVEGAAFEVIEITEVHLGRTYGDSYFRGRDRAGHEQIFRFLPLTALRRLTPEDTTTDLGSTVKATQQLPMGVDDEVLVHWKRVAGKDVRLAVRITIY